MKAALKPPTPEEAAAELLRRQEASTSLYQFLRQAWPHIEGARPLRDGWALQAVCEHLDAVISGQIRDFILNIPPRMTKSTAGSVCLTPYAWTTHPELQFLYLSYSDKLSQRDHVKARRLIECDWYQARWGNKFNLAHDQNTKVRYDNNHGGYRVTTSLTGTVTGEGGDIIVCFPAGTLVFTSEGPLPIELIVGAKLRVKVLSFNHGTGQVEWHPIRAWHESPATEMVEIELDDRTIRCTANHPVFVDGKGYIAAGNLAEGDVVTVLPSLQGTEIQQSEGPSRFLFDSVS